MLPPISIRSLRDIVPLASVFRREAKHPGPTILCRSFALVSAVRTLPTSYRPASPSLRPSRENFFELCVIIMIVFPCRSCAAGRKKLPQIPGVRTAVGSSWIGATHRISAFNNSTRCDDRPKDLRRMPLDRPRVNSLTERECPWLPYRDRVGSRPGSDRE